MELYKAYILPSVTAYYCSRLRATSPLCIRIVFIALSVCVCVCVCLCVSVPTHSCAANNCHRLVWSVVSRSQSVLDTWTLYLQRSVPPRFANRPYSWDLIRLTGTVQLIRSICLSDCMVESARLTG